MKALGLDAIIYDQINLKIHDLKKENVFRQTSKHFHNYANKEEVIETVMDALVRVSSTKSSLGYQPNLGRIEDLSLNLGSLELVTDVNQIADSLKNSKR